MIKLILNILLLSPFFGLGQNHAGKYFGTVENDTIGKIEICFNLHKDSTYEIIAQFDYYGILEGRCFDQETWIYKGNWLYYEDYLFFKPCKSDEHLSDSTYKCHCCEFPNDDFDLWETLRVPFKSEREKQKYRKKRIKINQPFRDLGYDDRLKVELETHEIFFHFGWDCHEQVWIDHPVKKIE